MPYITGGTIQERRTIWRLSIITDLFWGIVNFFYLLCVVQQHGVGQLLFSAPLFNHYYYHVILFVVFLQFPVHVFGKLALFVAGRPQRLVE
jgi:hypothetical protein